MAIKVIHTKVRAVDPRGGIAHLVNGNLKLREVLRITSKAGSIRSNHYHKKDTHYLYVESGKCQYSEKPLHKPNAKIETVTLKPGDIVFTKPKIIHAVKFLEDSVLYAFSTQKRNQTDYEKDTIRVTIVK